MHVLISTLTTFLLLVFSAHVDSTIIEAAPPGFGVSITQNALDYAHQVLLNPVLGELIGRINVAPLNGSKSTVIGVVSYSLSHLKVLSVKFNDPVIKLVEGSGLSGSVTADGQLSFLWTVQYHLDDARPYVEASGSANLSISSLHVDTDVVVGESKGHPTLKCTSAKLSLGSYELTLHGAGSDIENVLLDLFNPIVKLVVNEIGSGELQKVINDVLSPLIETLPTIIPLPPGDKVAVNLSLSQAPNVTSTYIALRDKGEVNVHPPKTPPPYHPLPLPWIVPKKGVMVEFFLGEYVLDTAGWAYYTASLLNFTIAQKDLPDWFPILTTDLFEDILPKLYSMYPKRPFYFDLFASKAPTLDLSNGAEQGSVALQVDGSLNLNIIDKSNNTVNAIGLDVQVDSTLQFNTKNDTLYAKLYFVKFNATLSHSVIGKFDISLINFLLNLLLNSVFGEIFNAYLEVVGIPLPTIKGVQLVDPSVIYGDGYVGVLTSIHWNVSDIINSSSIKSSAPFVPPLRVQ